MKAYVYLYYLIYILSGGYWHYSFSYWYYSNISVSTFNNNMEWLFHKAEVVLFLLAFAILFKPLFANLHLLFFFILFVLDMYFQNFIKFESSLILTNFIPLLFYFLTNKKFSHYLNEITYGAILFISVGFITSCFRKVNSGWLNYNDTAIYSYILQFNKGYCFNTLIGNEILNSVNFRFWKILDYIVLLFEISFIVTFIKNNYFLLLSVFSVCFHIVILITLNINVFYPYIILYTIILDKLYFKKHLHEFLIIEKIVEILIYVLFSLFVIYSFDIHFFNRLLPVKFYYCIDYFYNIIALFLFVSVLVQIKFNKYASNIQ
jgi:hypothetical protein